MFGHAGHQATTGRMGTLRIFFLTRFGLGSSMKKVPSDICDKVRQKVGSSVQSIHLLDTEGLRLTQTHVETSED